MVTYTSNTTWPVITCLALVQLPFPVPFSHYDQKQYTLVIQVQREDWHHEEAEHGEDEYDDDLAYTCMTLLYACHT